MARKNSPLFSVGSVEKIDVETGESVPVEGGGMLMLPGQPGSCEWCHVVHSLEEPHNRDSLPYQIKFQTIHGRSPTWTDAMAHCRPEVQALWKGELVRMLKDRGQKIPDDLL